MKGGIKNMKKKSPRKGRSLRKSIRKFYRFLRHWLRYPFLDAGSRGLSPVATFRKYIKRKALKWKIPQRWKPLRKSIKKRTRALKCWFGYHFLNTADISSRGFWPLRSLSNFTKRHFQFDGIECRSIEGVLQSFKFEDETEQERICQLIGGRAKRAGRESEWQKTQTLYWRGAAYPRDSADYQQLLDRLYDAAFEQDDTFASALRETGSRALVHTMGSADPRRTVLTEREFCDRLQTLRTRAG